MRGILYVLTAVGVIALAFWAYRETHRTQTAMSELRALQQEIGALREGVSVQRAEWAWLNRPDRLRMLAELNYDRLRLMPLRPDQFGEIAQIAFPPPPPVDPVPDPPVTARDADDADEEFP
ncbi:cell division protein FtsL [Rhodobaculum claviforme]|uniref:Cell division protein FtsL n=1 Tax=Rhodobaculum claviforme TaxID=1549854 RepID=A0A934TJA8_9RHOB|nr:cell division protein FtsL [Rhodobaculum claviforme]MBK5926649.1 cell division protein FtsL [Rhodobaculum claviforme]